MKTDLKRSVAQSACNKYIIDLSGEKNRLKEINGTKISVINT